MPETEPFIDKNRYADLAEDELPPPVAEAPFGHSKRPVAKRCHADVMSFAAAYSRDRCVHESCKDSSCVSVASLGPPRVEDRESIPVGESIPFPSKLYKNIVNLCPGDGIYNRIMADKGVKNKRKKGGLKKNSSARKRAAVESLPTEQACIRQKLVIVEAERLCSVEMFNYDLLILQILERQVLPQAMASSSVPPANYLSWQFVRGHKHGQGRVQYYDVWFPLDCPALRRWN